MLGLLISEPHDKVDDVIFEVLNRDVSAPISLPLSSVLLQSIRATWTNPASAPTSTKCLDHMYRVQESSASFLYTHPKPNSLIVSSASKGKRHQTTPQDREGRKVDSYGRRFYSTGALGIKVANYLACISRFVFGIFEDFSQVLPLLPDEHREKLATRS